MGGGGFVFWPRRPYPDDCCGSIDPMIDDDTYPVTQLLAPPPFPARAWNPDLLALSVLPDFFAQDWRAKISLSPAHSFGHPSIAQEISELVALGRTHRHQRVGEIRDQDTKFHDYFAQLMMITPYSHPDTFTLFKMGARVGEVLMTVYKREHERPRPQQFEPRLIPLLDLPGHSSYPSGHALISRLIALCLAELVANYRDSLMALSNRIGQNREIAGLHFPSDTAAGVSVAEQAFPLLQACPSYGRVRKGAAAEWP